MAKRAKSSRAKSSRRKSSRAKSSRRPSQPARKTKAGLVAAEIPAADVPDYVVVELRYEAPVAFTASRFAAPAAAEPQADSLNNILARFDIASMRSQFQLPASAIRSRVEVAATLPPEPAPERFARRGMDTEFIQSSFVQVVPKKSADAKKIATAFNRQKSVWKAYVAPRPVPAMPAGSAAGSRNFEPAQGYLSDAPDGIGAAGGVGSCRRQGQGHHHLRHRRQLESHPRRSAVGNSAARRHRDRRSRMAQPRDGGAGRDDLDP